MPSSPFTLHYWPSIPGRGEYVRLAFESTGTAYAEKNDAMDVAMTTTNGIGHPPHFAVPVLEVHDAPRLLDAESEGSAQASKVPETAGDKDSKGAASASQFISQTPAILAYLAPILGLDGVGRDDDSPSEATATAAAANIRRAQVNALTCTALDINNEAHDTHHPVAVGDYYENQKDESKRRAADFRQARLTKFFKFFNLTVESNPTQSGWLVGEHLTTADLALYQVIDGLIFAFPKRMAALDKGGHYKHVFALHDKVRNLEPVAKYLASDRRKQYSMGIFRHYPELDGDE